MEILAISGSLEAGEHGDQALAAARKIGANAGLKKPFTPDALMDSVGRLLDPA